MAYSYELTDEEKQELLRIARATLMEFTERGLIPPGKPHRKSLVEEAAVFVTLRVNGELRGCVGTDQENRPIYRAVQEMAVAAASRDSRFEPITEDELDDLTIEISVLGARTQIQSTDEITIGTHGLTIEHGDKAGLLLPQVAVEGGWSAEAFVQNLCKKAGLPGDAWRDSASCLSQFTAQVFDEITYRPPKTR